MKLALIAFLFALPVALPAFAQIPPAPSTAACGPEKARFNLKLDTSQHVLAQPESGKALIYFIQDFGGQALGISVVTWVGLDGVWVGATNNNSYFSASLEPGEHHMCSMLRARFMGYPVEFTHFSAEAGKVYYFRARYIDRFFFIDAVDSDEARYQIDRYPQSISQPKK